MSMVIKTVTPFINKEVLMEALDELGVKYTVQGNNIVTERKDYEGRQIFEYRGQQYILQHDSWVQKSVNSFLKSVEKAYLSAEKRLAEAERKRLEEEKRKFVEQRKNTIIEKAKAQGYHVREVQKQNQVQLVMVRHSY